MTPQQLKAMKLALEALIAATPVKAKDPHMQAVAITAIEEVLAEHAMQEVQRLGQEIEQERNFCHRCGKRTKDIHTCTPPKETK
jgi:hypothetical protein